MRFSAQTSSRASRLLTHAALGLAAFAMAGTACAQTLRLKPEISVTGDTIRLNQLIEGLTENDDQPVFRAPVPGARGTIRAERVLEAARELGITGIEPGAVKTVAILRPGRAISRKEMEDVIAQSATKRGNADNLGVMLDETSGARVVNAALVEGLQVASLKRDVQSGRFEAKLMLPGGTEASESWIVTGSILETREILVPASDLDRGDAIDAKDLVLVKRPAGQVAADVVLTKEDLIGMVPRRVLRAGEPIRSSDIARPILVEKNQLVTVVYIAKGFSLSMRGRAGTNGVMGETIKVQNPQSKRFVEGVVTGPGQISVTGTTPQPATLAEAIPQKR